MSEKNSEKIAVDIPSPCVGVCKIPQDDSYCQGCLRSRAEIKAWRSADPEWRLAVLEQLKQRRQQIWGVKPRRKNARHVK